MKIFRTILQVLVVISGFAIVENSSPAGAAQPAPYERQADFTDHSQNYPSVPHDGTDLDDEFNAIKTTTDDILDNLELIQRDDGDIANDTIGADQLKDEIDLSVNPAGDWVTATAYDENDAVWYQSILYRCLEDHTSGTFATDLAAEKWSEIVDFATYVDAAQTDATAAAASAAAAAVSASAAAGYVDSLTGTSVTSVAIGSGSKSFTTQSGKFFATGTRVLISSDANPTVNYMFGTVTAYSSTSLTVSVAATGGSGTYTDWTIRVSGERGATGAQGPAGAGTGDMLAANNLSDLASKPTSRINLGVQIGADVQAWDVNLDAMAGLSPAADKGVQFTSTSGAMATYDLTTAGKALLDDASATAQRTTLGLGSAATLTAGTAANNVVQLDGSAKLPAVDGSALTNLSSLSSGWRHIKSVTASGSSAIDFANGVSSVVINSTYDVYAVAFQDVVPVTDGANLMMRTSTDAGSTFAASSSDYVYSGLYSSSSSSSASANVSTGANSIVLFPGAASQTERASSGIIYIHNPAGTTSAKRITWQAAGGGTTAQEISITGSGRRDAIADVDAFRFMMSSGNIASGVFSLYGLYSP